MAGLGSLGKLAMSLGRELFGSKYGPTIRLLTLPRGRGAGVTMDTLPGYPSRGSKRHF